MIEALRPAYEAVLKGLEWTLDKFSDVDEAVHAGKAQVLAAIDKLRAELGLPVMARGSAPLSASAAATADVDAFVASLGQ